MNCDKIINAITIVTNKESRRSNPKPFIRGIGISSLLSFYKKYEKVPHRRYN